MKRRARANQASDASRTYVTASSGVVVGYYAIAASGIAPGTAQGRFRRNMPDPIPVAVLGRLAVDRAWQGRGLARALFRDAAFRIAQAGDVLAIRGVIVHALSESAKSFYLALGFDVSPLDPMTLMITLADVRQVLAECGS